MRLVATVWYVFLVLVLAAIAQSATTYVPSAQVLGDRMLTITMRGFAVLAGLGASGLSIFRKLKPQSSIFESKRASRVALGFAGVLTVVVLFGVIG